MLSSILSRLFWFCFILTLIGGLTTIAAHIMKKPVRIHYGKNATMTFSEPGIRVIANRSSSEEAAPDTTINYMMKDSNDHMISGGSFKVGEKDMWNSSKKLQERIDSLKGRYKKLEIDTTITLMGQRHDPALDVEVGPAIETRDSSQGVYLTNDSNANTVFFKDMWSVNKFLLLKEFKPVNRISQESHITEALRIMPANRWQQVGFILYDLTRFACLCLLFLCLGRLFHNFSKRTFFTRPNIVLLKRTGWVLLIPSLAAVILYWSFLVKIHPVKLVMDKNSYPFPFATYDINSGIDWTLILLGAGLLVLGYIFTKGLEIKEEQDQYI